MLHESLKILFYFIDTVFTHSEIVFRNRDTSKKGSGCNSVCSYPLPVLHLFQFIPEK